MAENFNFDEWSCLARVAPDEFETRRHSAIEKLIANGTNARRLRGLQCRIDLERIRARTPLKACLRLSSMMWDSLDQCRGALNRFTEVTGHYAPPKTTAHLPPVQTAKILPFKRPAKR